MADISSISISQNAAEQILMDRGRAAFAIRFPEQEFDNSTWSTRHLKKAGAGQGNVAIHFCRIRKGYREEVLPPKFSNYLKAYLAISGMECGSMVNVSTGVRWLWEAVFDRLGENVDAFSWQGLTKADVERAEDAMLESGMSRSSVYRRCINLGAFITFLSKLAVISPMQPIIKTPRQESVDRYTLGGQEDRMKHLPSEEAISALADVYSGRYKLSPFDQLLVCIPTIMFVPGFRIIEAIQLTTTALRKEGKQAFLHFFKPKDDKFVEDKVSISKMQEALAKDVIERALILTKDARERAKELVGSPDVFPLPSWAMGKELLSASEVAELTGLHDREVNKLPKSVLRIKTSLSKTLSFDRASLQQHLQLIRESQSPESIRGVTQKADGTWLPLDEALFISFRNENHKNKSTSRLIVELLSQQQVGTFLGGHANGLKSIFEKLSLCERDGRTISLNAHDIRHYVTSKASGAGISDTHLMRWQRRKHAGDLEAYKHLTSEERITRLREHIKNGRLQGDIATMYFQLAPDEKDIFLESVVQAIHVTHLGFCVHDFNASPCPSAMNCVKKCGSYLFDTEDEDQRKRLIKLQLRNDNALDDAIRAQEGGKGVLVEEWVTNLKETSEGIKIVLNAKPTDESSMVAPFKGEKSRYEPLV